jgi:iron complex outermembrane receptor protein
MKKISAKKFVMGLILCGFIAQNSQAKDVNDYSLEDLEKMSLDELMEVQVYSASKRPEKLSETPSSAFVLTSKDIQKAGATSIPEALRLVPGVQVAQINSNNWAISIRGFNRQFSNKLLVLVDGRAVYTPLFAGVFWNDLDYVLEDIDRIEVIRGPGGTLWGANAVNGVINIITKEARKTQDNYASITTGTFDNTIAEYRYGGNIREINHYRAYGKFRKQSDFKRVGVDKSNDDDWQRGQTGFRYDFRDSDFDPVTVQGDYYYGRRLSNLQVPTSTLPFVRNDDFTEDSTGGNFMFKWNKPTGDLKNELTGYVDYQYRDSNPINQQELTTYNAEYQGNYDKIERHEFTLGTGYRLITSNLNSTNLISYTPETKNISIFNAFLQDKYSIINKKLFLTLGSKVDHNDFTGFEVQPNARLLYQISKSHSIWAAVSRAVRTPSIAEDTSRLASPGIPLGAVYSVGNPSYQSENLHAYELGYRGDITKKLYFDISTFYNDYNDLRTFERISSGPIIAKSFNNGTAESYGFEAYAVAGVSEKLDVKAGYTFLTQDSHVKNSTDTSLARDEDRSPNIQYNISTDYKVSETLSWNNYLYYVSDLAYYTPLGARRNISDYTRADTVFNWSPKKNLTISIFGRNLFDNWHQEFDEILYSTPSEVPRTFGVQARVKF